mmetsp:Transcript_42687/g.65500  ORF Transcript_42687/g.65500 Transcript_42687/m.65500 type:complete len:102 (-) Transcript_42687:1762-2067(-)
MKRLEREKKEAQSLKEFTLALETQISECFDPSQTKEMVLLKKLDYFILKVKYHMLFRDLDNCRKFLYKIDLFLQDNFPTENLPNIYGRFKGYVLRSDFLVL